MGAYAADFLSLLLLCLILNGSMGKKSYYGVRVGRGGPRIYRNWAEVRTCLLTTLAVYSCVLTPDIVVFRSCACCGHQIHVLADVDGITGEWLSEGEVQRILYSTGSDGLGS